MKGGVKSTGNVVPVHIIKASRGAESELHLFLTSAVDDGEWSTL
jgi:hypothetical protein